MATPSTGGNSHDAQRTSKGLASDSFVLFGAGGFIAGFVAFTLLFGSIAQKVFSATADWLILNLNWLYIGGVSLGFFFLLGLFVSRFGNVRLGDDDEEPRYRLSTWFAMLFAGGMGATLMFWGVAEPLYHSVNAPRGGLEAMSDTAIEQAFGFTFYHFGIHMWVIMTVPGLALGYFIHKRKLPPRLSSVFVPILHHHIYGVPGKVIDVLAIIGTVFGIGVSVGLGTLQINAGMNILWGTPLIGWVELSIILVITAAGAVSVATGLDKGIKILSNVNIAMAVMLMLFILVTGPTLKLLNFTVESFGIYLDWMPQLMFWTDAMQENPGWQGSWTVFYWAWSICWSPYVGMFVASISQGRTVREFIGGVLFLPAIFDVIWFSILGRAGIEAELSNPGRLSEPVVQEGNVPFALFGLLQEYPLTMVISVLALAVIVIFFITSIDSAAMVIDNLATGEANKTPVYYRIGWAIAIGAVTAAILLIGESQAIDTLQQVVIIVAFPFFIMQFVMMYSVLKGLTEDSAVAQRVRTRQWEKTDSPEKLAEAEAREQPKELDFELDDDGRVVFDGDVVIGGSLGVGGEMTNQEEERNTRVVEQSRPRPREEWDS